MQKLNTLTFFTLTRETIMRNVDVLIIGAGLSGIGAACHLTRNCPNKSYTILERRQNIGGTWDLFRYPGVRSDSDMFTLGYSFRPWTSEKVLADGESIRNYIKDTADEFKVKQHIQFGLKVISSNYSSKEARWTVTVVDEASGETQLYSCEFVISCTGYYNYDEGFTPEFKDSKKFTGKIIHPQHWPQDLDYSDKKVVIIGSGATAVTLVPEMAKQAAHVTMLQRSPTYIATVPDVDPISVQLRKFLPEMVVYRMARVRNIGLQRTIYRLAQDRPKLMKRVLLSAAKRQLGNDVDMANFTPNYNPWDQRLCAVPNGDLFKTIKQGHASVVTEQIDCFTEKGIKLRNGDTVEADIVVTATGLNIQMLGGAQATIDGKAVQPSDSMVYRGVMLRDIPNMAMIFGYTNSSWTLKADIACEYICRLLNHMDKIGAHQVIPRDHENCASDKPMMDMQSGYLTRSASQMPKQGTQAPWQVLNDYVRDLPLLRYGRVDDKSLEFIGKHKHKRPSILKSLLSS